MEHKELQPRAGPKDLSPVHIPPAPVHYLLFSGLMEGPRGQRDLGASPEVGLLLLPVGVWKEKQVPSLGSSLRWPLGLPMWQRALAPHYFHREGREDRAVIFTAICTTASPAECLGTLQLEESASSPQRLYTQTPDVNYCPVYPTCNLEETWNKTFHLKTSLCNISSLGRVAVLFLMH